jgi:hypothetical protein
MGKGDLLFALSPYFTILRLGSRQVSFDREEECKIPLLSLFLKGEDVIFLVLLSFFVKGG